MRNTFRFYKTAFNRWFIDLPDWNGSIDDLEMVQGADTMLDKVSHHTNECYLELSDELFEGADLLTLADDLSDTVGGGIYLLENYKGDFINHKMWLCGVTVDVFGTLPERIFVGYPEQQHLQHTHQE